MDPAVLSRLRSFRELDESAGQPKGSAFRVFKRLTPPLRDNEDFLLLSPDVHADAIQGLRHQERIYRSSVTVVLLEPAAAERIAAHLAHD